MVQFFPFEGKGALEDKDLFMLRCAIILSFKEKAFSQFLAGAGARELDLYVPIRLQSGEGDEVAGKVDDLDRLAHIKYEQLASNAKGRSLEYQIDRLRDGHKVPFHLWVRYSHRPTSRDLAFEAWYHTATAPQDVAKAYSNKVPTGSVSSILDK
jgi:hypothetical protein